jgi:hypothetical protein
MRLHTFFINSIMPSKTLVVLLTIIVVAGAIVYRQQVVYRTPLTESANKEIQALFLDDVREVRRTEEGVLHSVSLDEIIISNPSDTGIPSIDQPVYESVYVADQYLDNSGLGLLVEVSGKYRFYPFQILVWHEAVNETFNGKSLLVTYSPLTASGNVFERMFGDEAVPFRASGKIWNNNTLLLDSQSESLWSQILGEALVGELTGSTLNPYPSLTVSWSTFKTHYPSGEVLSRKTNFDRDYTQDPYEQDHYYESSTILFPLSNEDDRLQAKTLVFGYYEDSDQTAYPLSVVEESGVVNDEVGENYILVIWDNVLETVRGYTRQVGTDVLTFYQGDEFFIDDQTGSLWNRNGECVGGTYLGSQLEALTLKRMYWFSWGALYPETKIFNY